jgi:hypothetical protein
MTTVAATRQAVAITKADIEILLANTTESVNAVVTYVSKYKIASPKNNQTVAANPNAEVYKVVMARVTLFKDVDHDLYVQAVKASAKEVGLSNNSDVKNFEVREPSFFHTDVYSVVQNKLSGKQYLYAHYQDADSTYFIDGVLANKFEVSQYLTPSEAKKLCEANDIVYNNTNDVYHAVICRTISLENIINIKIV